MSYLVLETERLLLDELVAGRDDLFVFQLLNEPGFLENIGDREIYDPRRRRPISRTVRGRATGTMALACGV